MAATLRGLTHRYAGAPAAALRDVDADLGPGLHVVAGESGSGKSTLLRVFNGLVPHFHGGDFGGSAVVAGLDVASTPTRRLARHAGLVFQDPEMQFLGGSVEREVGFGPANLGVPRGALIDRVDEALQEVGIEALRRRPVASLSGGERQRAAVAAALAMRPELLALDEPTSQLDPAGAEAVSRVCLRLAASGMSVVLAEHRLDRFLPNATSVLVLEAGAVVAAGPPERVAADLPAPPAVVELALLAGWRPLPLDATAARGRLTGLRRLPAPPTTHRHDAWTLGSVSAGPGRKAVVAGVDLVGGSGEVVVLMGPNGGGKTTLLRTVAGLLRPLAGTVWRVGGRIAYLPQNPTALLHRATVREEVALTLRAGRDREPPELILGRLGLARVAGRHPRDLSTGERQRAALAAVLCGAPTLALLDEPTRGMDAATRGALAALVRALAGRGCAVVIATHDPDLAARVADRVVEVRGGGVRDLGPPRRALSAPSPYATQLGTLLTEGPLTAAEALALQ